MVRNGREYKAEACSEILLQNAVMLTREKSVEMKLELGHRASMRDEPTAEGFTHDWLVFVKGAEGSNIFTFVDKVVFHLHESFPKPRRVVKEPPYQVAESGYAGFTMPIDVYFRSKEEPKKVRFEYDLFLRLEGSPVYNIRREKLTFQNPSEDFRRKLLKAREGLIPYVTVVWLPQKPLATGAV